MTKQVRVSGVFFALTLVTLTVAGLVCAIGLKLEYEVLRVGAHSAVPSVDAEIADWTFGMLITSMLSVGVTIGGLYWVVQSLAATIKANELSSRSLEISERAWIKTTPRALSVKKIYPDENWEINLVFDNMNCGKTVALEVRTSARATWYGNQLQTLKELVEGADAYRGSGIMLFPSETFERVWNIGPDVENPPKTEDEKSTAGITSMLVGVISYRTIFDDVIHRTAFVYEIRVGDEGKVVFSPWAGGYAT